MGGFTGESFTPSGGGGIQAVAHDATLAGTGTPSDPLSVVGSVPPSGSITTTELGGDITAAGEALLVGANAAAQRATLGLGTAATEDVSAFDPAGAASAAVSSLSSSLDGIAFTGSGADLTNATVSISKLGVDVTAFAKSFLDDADAATARTTLGAAALAALATVATSGSASDLGTGTLPIERIANDAVTIAKLSPGSANLKGTQSFSTTGTVNDFALNANVSVLQWTGGTAGTLNGITAGVAAQVLVIENPPGTAALTVNHESVSSVAANRIIGFAALNMILSGAGSTLTLRYDGALSRWRVIGIYSARWPTSLTLDGGLTAGGSLSVTGTGAFNSTLSLGGNISESGFSSPASISSVNDNYAIPSLHRQLRLSLSAAASLSGFVAQVNGRKITVHNISAFDLTFTHDDTNSSIANRFFLPGNSPLRVPPNASVSLIYDSSSSRWRVEGDVAEPTVIRGVQTDTSTIQQNDFAISANVSVLRWSGATSTTFSGFAKPGGNIDGDLLVVQNLSLTGTFSLGNENVSSAAANRIISLGTTNSLVLSSSAGSGCACATLLYDGTVQRWRVLSFTTTVYPVTCSFSGAVTVVNAFTASSTATFSSVINETGISSPAAISGSLDDYTPSSITSTRHMRQALSAAAALTGLLAGASGRCITIHNLSTTFTLTLKNEDTNSATGNRFVLPGGADFLIGPGDSITTWYDITSTRWRIRR